MGAAGVEGRSGWGCEADRMLSYLDLGMLFKSLITSRMSTRIRTFICVSPDVDITVRCTREALLTVRTCKWTFSGVPELVHLDAQDRNFIFHTTYRYEIAELLPTYSYFSKSKKKIQKITKISYYQINKAISYNKPQVIWNTNFPKKRAYSKQY